MDNCSCDYKIIKKTITSDMSKIHINLDDDLSVKPISRLIKKVVCAFMYNNNELISLSKNTTVKFHTLLELHAGHHFHHYNYNLGKKKHFFTDKKHEEEGLNKNDLIWILDFGWTLHDDNEREHSNHMEFSFHFSEHEEMEMIMIVLYEDEEYAQFEFGWLQSKLEMLSKINDYALQKVCDLLLM